MLIQLKNIETRSFKSFDLNVKQGDKILIYGKSGIGKSTILKLILGFDKPKAGEILFKGQQIDEKNVWEVRNNVSYIPQELNVWKGGVMEFLKRPFKFESNKEKKFNKKRLMELLKKFELNESICKKKFEDLSLGEKQRIVIISSLLLDKKIILADEITSSLNKELKEMVANYFLNLGKQYTIVIVSHDSVWNNKKLIKKELIK